MRGHWVEQGKKAFEKHFGASATGRAYFSPGRVNLIGEHTDYNGGHVFPCALTMGTYGLIQENDQKCLRLYSENFPEAGLQSFPMDAYVNRRENGWCNYVLAVCDQFLKLGYGLQTGLDLYVEGDLPNGAGLSSSASLEMLVAVALNEIFGEPLSRLELVQLARRAENQFIGVQCGIMDQFAIGMGEAAHALLLNTETLAYTAAPVKLQDHGLALLIVNTNKKRALADSKYNERLGECQQALAMLQSIVEISNLCALDEAGLNHYGHVITDPVAYKRARHAITENQRTLRAAQVLAQNDFQAFGDLMAASHHSLKVDYEVSCYELDVLVSLLGAEKSVLGARMTGAGFGGCVVALVQASAIETLKETVGPLYHRATGLEADFYPGQIGAGTGRLE